MTQRIFFLFAFRTKISFSIAISITFETLIYIYLKALNGRLKYKKKRRLIAIWVFVVNKIISLKCNVKCQNNNYNY